MNTQDLPLDLVVTGWDLRRPHAFTAASGVELRMLKTDALNKSHLANAVIFMDRDGHCKVLKDRHGRLSL